MLLATSLVVVADRITVRTTVSVAMPKVKNIVAITAAHELNDAMFQHSEHTTLARLNSAIDLQFLSSFRSL